MGPKGDAMADIATQGAPEYVGFWKRFLAAIIDVLILVVIIVPAELAIFGTNYVPLALEGKTLSIDIWIQVVIPLAIAILFWRYRSGTPGLMAISAKIVDAETLRPASVGKLAIRGISLVVIAVLIVPLGIGLLWIAFDKRKQGWHDKLAGTVVIRAGDD
jgi:uncharacterized RDD family membrane protein YckC